MSIQFAPAATPPDSDPTGPDGELYDAARWRPRMRLGLRSLTAQLVVGVVGLVVVVVGTVGATLYFTQRSLLVQRIDEKLTQIAQGNAQSSLCRVNGAPSVCLSDPSGGYVQGDTEWVTVLSDTGSVVAQQIHTGSSLRLMQLTAAQASAIANDPSGIATLTTLDGEQLRVTGRALPESPLIVVSGVSTDDVRKPLGQLLFNELIIGAGAVLVASFVTAYGVRFTLRRLRRVTATAQDVAAELSPEGAGLDRRVPEHDSDTEVGQLASSFNMMLSAVETQFHARVESEERMRRFMADASHELRTPLTSIRGYAELARMQRAAGTATVSDDDNLDRIEFEGTRMSRLVEDLLLLARGDAADRDPARQLVELDTVVDYAVSGARAAFPARTIDVVNAGAPYVIGDADQLLRVVRNLVANAAVHTHLDRPITVRLLADGSDAVVQVIDGGPGLAPEDAAHVFERFWRADKARTRARGGSGLGMSIVASIVRAHGGSVRFDSTVAGGSTVTVRLPAAEPD